MIATAEPRVLVFDSGIGGLSVLKELAITLPHAQFIYVADDAGFPYGGKEERALTRRVVNLMSELITAHKPDMVVIACNTASTLVLSPLRAQFSVPFVGTVPAIKPAAALTRTRMITVLATPGTVRRDYTRALIDTYASHVQVALVGSTELARLAEAHLAGSPVSDDAVRNEITPCFRQLRERRTDAIVLGCTHYPFLMDTFKRLAPWPVTWIDPAPAIARRAAQLMAPPPPTPARKTIGAAHFTSRKAPSATLAQTLKAFRLTC
jgi:glutamate racemase